MKQDRVHKNASSLFVEDTDDTKEETNGYDDERGETAGDREVHHSSPTRNEKFIFNRKILIFMADTLVSNPRKFPFQFHKVFV